MKSGTCERSSVARCRRRLGWLRFLVCLVGLFQSPATTKKAREPENQVRTTDAGGPQVKVISCDPRIRASATHAPATRSFLPLAGVRPGRSGFANSAHPAVTWAEKRWTWMCQGRLSVALRANLRIRWGAHFACWAPLSVEAIFFARRAGRNVGFFLWKEI